MNKMFFAAIILLLSLLALSCTDNVPKTEYDKVVSNLAAAQSQIASLQTNITSIQSQITSLQTELTTDQSQIKSLQADLDASRASLKQAALRVAILNSVFLPVLKGQQQTQSQQVAMFLEWRDKITASGNPQLTSKFQAILDNVSNTQKLNTAMTDFFVYLLESLSTSLK